MPLLLIDTNLLMLLVVGATDRTYIKAHKRLQDYDENAFDILIEIVAAHEGLVTTPHILAEVSNLSRQIANPARDRIQHTFRQLIHRTEELRIPSADGCSHDQFIALGLTDAVALSACEPDEASDLPIELITADEALYNHALARGLPATLF